MATMDKAEKMVNSEIDKDEVRTKIEEIRNRVKFVQTKVNIITRAAAQKGKNDKPDD